MNIRKAYQRAILVPMIHMDTLWKEYEQFEKSIPNNEVLMQNVMKHLRPKVEAAKLILKDRKALVEVLDLDALPSKLHVHPRVQ
jgi:cleavage stimulation factor subunit 3